MTQSTVLLTGATGFLGSHLLEALLKQGYKVVVLKRSTSDLWRIHHLIEGVTAINHDEVSLEDIFKNNNIDTVIHLATCYKKYEEVADIEEMTKSNISFPSGVLIQGLKYGLKHFINTGSYFEYDCSIQPVSEISPLKAFNYYAATKAAFENILQAYQEKLSTSTIRLFSPYGEKDNNKLIPMLIKKAFNGDNIKLSEGFQKIDPIYVKDIVSAYLKCLEYSHLKNNKNGHQVFNIGTGKAYSIREIASVIEEKSNKRLNLTWGEVSSNDYEHVYADIRKAKLILDWEPKYSLKEGVLKTIKYFRG